MPNTVAKFLLPLLMLSVAIPESEAKRMGSGRSTGRQVQAAGKTTPPPSARAAQPERSQQTQAPPAPAARQPAHEGRIAGPQSAPPAPATPSPPQALPREAASPWGGMLGGALLGLGLGSLMSRDGNTTQEPNRQSGSSGESGQSTSGTSGGYADAPVTGQPQPEANQQAAGGVRSILAIGLLALIIYFAVRRMRRANR